jgi:predicted nucleic acid-binding protein
VVIVDTNVVAWLYMGGDPSARARALFARDPDWRSEHLVLVELTNVLATIMRTRNMAVARAREVFEDAQAMLARRLVEIDHGDAIEFAHRYRVTAYDARFLVAAAALDTRLVTEDRALRRAAPALTRSLDEALSA